MDQGANRELEDAAVMAPLIVKIVHIQGLDEEIFVSN